MNNPVVLTAIGVLLTGLAFAVYLRWRRSPRGLSAFSMLRILFRNRSAPDGKSAGAGDASNASIEAAILAGTVRRPMEEVKRLFSLWILFGFLLAILSLFLRRMIPNDDQRWIAFVFLIVGLAAAVGGAVLSERLDRAGVVERIAGYLAHRLGVDPVRITCIACGIVLFTLAEAARSLCGWDSARALILVSSVLGIILGVIGIWGPRLSRLFVRRSAPDAPVPPGFSSIPPAEDRVTEAPLGRKSRPPVRKRKQPSIRKRKRNSRRS